MDNNKNQINIELTEEIAQGKYSNLAMITHSPSEFVIDFIGLLPNMPKAKVLSRIVMTPDHAKRLLAALQDNIAKYENQYGPIALEKGSSNLPPMSFNNNTYQA